MDVKFGQTIEQIAYSGDEGIKIVNSDDPFLYSFLSLYSNIKHDSLSGRWIMKLEARRSYITDYRILNFTETSWKLLERIIATGSRGISQIQLAKDTEIDARSLFHFLKSIVGYELICRVPICINKTFTYQLIYHKFMIEDEDAIIENDIDSQSFLSISHSNSPIQRENGNGPIGNGIAMSKLQTKERIMAYLMERAQDSVKTSDIYQAIKTNKKIKYVRRIIWELLNDGYISLASENGQNQHFVRMVKFVRPFVNTKSSLSSLSSIRGSSSIGNNSNFELTEFKKRIKYASWLKKGLYAEEQIRDFIDWTGQRGALLTEISWAFGISTKDVYKIHEKLIKDTENGKEMEMRIETKTEMEMKSESEPIQTFLNRHWDVVRKSELRGKQRQHRLFTIKGQDKPAPQELLDQEGQMIISRNSMIRMESFFYPPPPSSPSPSLALSNSFPLPHSPSHFHHQKETFPSSLNLQSESILSSDRISTNSFSIDHDSIHSSSMTISPTRSNTISVLGVPIYRRKKDFANTIDRGNRMDAILFFLQQSKIIEIGKLFADKLRDHLKLSTIIDVKTLRRTIDLMERDGLLRIISLTPQAFTRRFIVKWDTPINDPIINKFLEEVRREGEMPRERTKQQDMQENQNIQEARENNQEESKDQIQKDIQEKIETLSLMIPKTKSKFITMNNHDHVFGIMNRCRLLHEYILSLTNQNEKGLNNEMKENTFITSEALFQKLPFDLFVKIVGISSNNSKSKSNLNLDSNSISIFNNEKEIMQKRFTKHRSVIRELLTIMEDLSLISKDANFPPQRFQFCYQYIINLQIGFYSFPQDLMPFWNWLAEIQNVNKKEIDELLSIFPNIRKNTIKIILAPGSWSRVTSSTRKTRKYIENQNEFENENNEFEMESKLNDESLITSSRSSSLITSSASSRSFILESKSNFNMNKSSKPIQSKRKMRELSDLKDWNDNQILTCMISVILVHHYSSSFDNLEYKLISDNLIMNKTYFDVYNYAKKILLGHTFLFRQLLELEGRIMQLEIINPDPLKESINMNKELFKEKCKMLFNITKNWSLTGNEIWWNSSSILWNSWNKKSHSRKGNFQLFSSIPHFINETSLPLNEEFKVKETCHDQYNFHFHSQFPIQFTSQINSNFNSDSRIKKEKSMINLINCLKQILLDSNGYYNDSIILRNHLLTNWNNQEIQDAIRKMMELELIIEEEEEIGNGNEINKRKRKKSFKSGNLTMTPTTLPPSLLSLFPINNPELMTFEEISMMNSRPRLPGTNYIASTKLWNALGSKRRNDKDSNSHSNHYKMYESMEPLNIIAQIIKISNGNQGEMEMKKKSNFDYEYNVPSEWTIKDLSNLFVRIIEKKRENDNSNDNGDEKEKTHTNNTLDNQRDIIDCDLWNASCKYLEFFLRATPGISQGKLVEELWPILDREQVLQLLNGMKSENHIEIYNVNANFYYKMK